MLDLHCSTQASLVVANWLSFLHHVGQGSNSRLLLWKAGSKPLTTKEVSPVIIIDSVFLTKACPPSTTFVLLRIFPCLHSPKYKPPLITTSSTFIYTSMICCIDWSRGLSVLRYFYSHSPHEIFPTKLTVWSSQNIQLCHSSLFSLTTVYCT